MATKAAERVANVKTPGAVAAGADLDPVDGAADLAPLPGDPGPQQPMIVTPVELQRMILAGVSQAMDARAKASLPVKEDELPDQSEIDPATIKRPTLSKQGYVVPLGYGEPADPSIKR